MRCGTPPKGARGLSLAMVLMVAALAFTITSVLVGTSFFHLNFANRTQSEGLARALAEAAVARSLEHVVKSPPGTGTFGLPGKPGWREPVVVEPEWAPEGAYGVVVFSNTLYGKERLAFSTNNLAGDLAVEGFSQGLVPKRSVRLIGTGMCNSVRICVEVYFYAPPFPYSIGSAGPVVSDGGLVVGSLGEGKVTKLTAVPSTDDLKPGHLRSNAIVKEAVKLGKNTVISGNVESAGGIKLAAETEVRGSAKPFSGTNPLPQVEPASYDPDGEKNPAQFTAVGSELTSPKLDGVSRAPDDLTIYGDLELNGGVLFVKGNLHVTGGIKGKGAVITMGDMLVDRASAFEAKNQVALLSDQDMVLKGTGTDRSTIQGMMYCNGNFESSDLTLMGSLVKGGDPEAVVNVSNSKTIQVPEYTRLVMKPKPPPKAPGAAAAPKYDNANNPALMYNVGGMPPQGTTWFIGFWGAQANSSGFYDAATDSYKADDYDRNDVGISFGTHGPGGWNQFVLTGPAAFNTCRSGPWAQICGNPIGGTPESIADGIAAQVRANVAAYNAQHQEYRLYEKGEGDYGSADFTFDVNEFLMMGDRMRQLLWRTF